jgi:hypothetical protein
VRLEALLYGTIPQRVNTILYILYILGSRAG